MTTRKLALAAVLGAATELAGIALTATAAWLICRAAGQPPLVAIGLAVVAVRAFAISKGVLRYAERLVGHDAALSRLAAIRGAVFNGLVNGGRAAAPEVELRPADALSRMVSDVDGVQDRMLRVVLPAVSGALIALAAAGFVAWKSPSAALALGIGLVLAGLVVPSLVFQIAGRAARHGARVRAAMLETTVDVVHGGADLAALGLSAGAVGAGAAQAKQLAGIERRTGVLRATTDAVGSLLPGATAIAVLALAIRQGGSLTATDAISLPVMALVSLVAVELLLPLTNAAVRLAELQPGLARVDALALPPGPADAAAPDDPPPDVLRLSLNAVSATHPGAVDPALVGIDLDLPPGRRVALVGPSGAGKSTLLGVLAGTVPVTAGTVTVDDGEPAPLSRWHLAGGALSDGYVFHTTVRENVTVGRPGLAADAIRDALLQAGLAEWADSLDRIVGEQGEAVSGGQRQRLLLARAFVAPTPVLLLDEPTEGLDAAAADALLADIFTVAGAARRSVVIVSHRLAGLAESDEILVLDGGQVIQRGRHLDLIATPGWYADQWAAQRLVELAYAGLLPTRP